ncbi:ABC transporter substrate-binding protein [Jeotgalibaca caeni]|uniref:ABC transporter substrate-binding protein n=1 Tax=Jeotgalibaca caeni TaxID=3028623 RepID=UPI00237E2A6E|nr:ABC transporter substrate-binding protein [Jeotgalibaca caeni]MDE1549516.1 ABC transporter substrate-binding protein [Jeotgalibaca caeni]
MKKNTGWKTGILLGTTILLGACSGNEGEAASGEEEIQIGILQLMDHESLNASREGFIDVLEEAGYVEGENLQVDYQNAQGDQANLQTMSERLSQENELILAIATPSAQSLANIEKEIPILFTAVTDPVDAGLVESLEAPGGNITGTTDAGPIEEQINLLLSVVPEAQNIGIIYNSSEPNSLIQADQATEILEANGKTVNSVTVSSTNEVQQAMESLAQDVEGIYIPTDNTLASTMATVAEVAKDYQIPVVAASTDQVLAGGLATYGIDYYELGRQTGEMALEIIENDADPASLAVESSTNLELVINEEMAEALGIDPASIKVPE